MEESDERLLEQWVLGDLEAFDKFYTRHIGKVSGYVRKKGVAKDEVGEVVQDSFLKMHLHITDYQPEKRALPWFFTIVHNTCVDNLKRGGKSKKNWHPVSLEALEQAVEAQQTTPNENDLALEFALGALKPEQRSLLGMRLLNEMSFEEMALSTGKSPVSLRKSYSRAIQVLRDLINKRK